MADHDEDLIMLTARLPPAVEGETIKDSPASDNDGGARVPPPRRRKISVADDDTDVIEGGSPSPGPVVAPPRRRKQNLEPGCQTPEPASVTAHAALLEDQDVHVPSSDVDVVQTGGEPGRAMSGNSKRRAFRPPPPTRTSSLLVAEESSASSVTPASTNVESGVTSVTPKRPAPVAPARSSSLAAQPGSPSAVPRTRAPRAVPVLPVDPAPATGVLVSLAGEDSMEALPVPLPPLPSALSAPMDLLTGDDSQLVDANANNPPPLPPPPVSVDDDVVPLSAPKPKRPPPPKNLSKADIGHPQDFQHVASAHKNSAPAPAKFLPSTKPLATGAAAAASTAYTWLAAAPDLPPVVRASIAYLIQPRALKEEGLFRIPGSKTKCDNLLAQFMEGRDIDLASELEPANIAGLLRSALKELSLPVDANVARMLEFAMTVDEADRLSTTIMMVRSLSAVQKQTLGALTRLFRKVELEPANKMTAENLGTSVGSTVFPSVSVQRCGDMIRFLIDHVDLIWEDTAALDDSVSVPPTLPPAPAVIPAGTRSF